MIDRHATPEDFARWEAKARTMSAEALAWSSRDASEAARCAEEMGCDANAGRYRDEALTYLRELEGRLDRCVLEARAAAEAMDRDEFGRIACDVAAASAARETLRAITGA